MYLAIDVYYASTSATAAGITFSDWNSPTESDHYIARTEGIAAYQPGSLYLRELPPLQQLLTLIHVPITAIIIDGYVTLGEDQRPGLGMHLWHSQTQKIPVIGVAKSFFQGTPTQAKLQRGSSKKPLFISSIGIPLEDAKNCIKGMHGEHRIPTLLKRVDGLSRNPRSNQFHVFTQESKEA